MCLNYTRLSKRSHNALEVSDVEGYAWIWCREKEENRCPWTSAEVGVFACVATEPTWLALPVFWQQRSCFQPSPARCPSLVSVWLQRSAWSKALANACIIRTWWAHSAVRYGFGVYKSVADHPRATTLFKQQANLQEEAAGAQEEETDNIHSYTGLECKIRR